jgi:hypothetical protein
VSGRPLNPNPGIIIWPPSSLTLPTSHRPPPSRASLFPHVPPLSLALDSSLARRPPPSCGGLIPHAALLPHVAASFLMPRSRASLTHHHLATLLLHVLPSFLACHHLIVILPCVPPSTSKSSPRSAPSSPATLPTVHQGQLMLKCLCSKLLLMFLLKCL